MTNEDLKEAIGKMCGKINDAVETVKQAVNEFDTVVEMAERDGYVGDLYRTDYTVTGYGAFPVDMLRYACSWPKDETDARAIEESLEQGSSADSFTIRLTRTHRDAKPNLAEQRWESKFRWKVLNNAAHPIETTRT